MFSARFISFIALALCATQIGAAPIGHVNVNNIADNAVVHTGRSDVGDLTTLFTRGRVLVEVPETVNAANGANNVNVRDNTTTCTGTGNNVRFR